MLVELFDKSRVRIKTELELQVDRYDAYAVGGPHTATITAVGPAESLSELRRWLGYYVIIRNARNLPVWWGKIETVETPYQTLSIGASLSEMYNAVQVLYGEAFATDWEEDARSIEHFGRRELRHSIGEASAAQAEQAATKIIAQAKLAQQSLSMSTSKQATIHCVGLWQCFNWTYYRNPIGSELYDADARDEQAIGWGLTSSAIGFADRKIHWVDGDLSGLQEGEELSISGSPANSGAFTVFSDGDEQQSYTSATIFFEAGDDIKDSAAGLGFIEMGSFIRVSGSPANSGYHSIDEIGRDGIATTGTITPEAAGPTITINKSGSLQIAENVAVEFPGAAVTIRGPQKLAYSFTLTDNYTWLVDELWLQLRRQGLPGDLVTVSLCASSGGAPGAVLDTVSVSGSSLAETMGWVKFAMNRTATVSYGNVYWIVVERTGASSTEHHYVVGVDESKGHAGTLRLWDGSAWVARPTDASAPFQLWGHAETGEQIEEILISEGQFIVGVDNRISTGIMRRTYRDGSVLALGELESLLDAGASAGAEIVPRVTPDWRVIVDVAPASIPEYRLLPSGKIMTINGTPIEPGVLPVGHWCTIDGLGVDDGDGLAPLSPFLIGYAEYNAKQGAITDIRAQGKKSIWDLGNTMQG